MATAQENRVAFISKANEDFVERLLVKDFNRRIGGELNSQQKSALEKRVKYYMTRVYNDPEVVDNSVQNLNKIVLQAVVPDYISYLNRPTRPSEEQDMEKIRNDVSSRFDVMQQERHDSGKQMPSAPKFQLSIEDNEPPTLSRLEELKKQREQEAYRYDPNMNEARMSPEEVSRRQGADDMMYKY